MPDFSLVLEYLTGYAVATDPAHRERPEWPPHPARVFMALAAAHFETPETGEMKAAERSALEWLAALEPPALTVPEAVPREVLTVYVPVNDQTSGEAIVKRSRQPRFFPRVYVGTEPVRQTWNAPNAQELEFHLPALESVCRKVTRIGHSSSLVWARMERETSTSLTLVPDEHALESQLRITLPGSLQRLEAAFNQAAIEEFSAFGDRLAEAKGKAKKELEAQRSSRFPRGRPESQRPTFSITRGYRSPAPKSASALRSPWDPNFLVLRQAEDCPQTPGLESTAQVLESLRKLIMKESPQPLPSWISGHEPNGDKLQSGSHLAFIPLPFVDALHADGHLLGVGIVVPRDVPYRARSLALSQLLFDADNQPRTLRLVMGRAGEWSVVRESSLTAKVSLQTRTYTRPSRCWASVTPVVLDRMPKTDRVNDPVGWREEVAGILSRSCRNVELPEPTSIRVEKTPFFRGSLRAMPGQGGFPQLRSGRFQVHVRLEFESAVEGPLLIGAGRFCGYGLMRPCTAEERP